MVTRTYTFLSRYGSKVMYNHSLEGGYSDSVLDGNIPFDAVLVDKDEFVNKNKIIYPEKVVEFLK